MAQIRKLLKYPNAKLMQQATSSYKMSHSMTKPTKWPVRPAMTQTSSGISPVWSVLAVRMQKPWVLISYHWVHNKDSDQTAWMRRLIRVIAGRICDFCWFCHTAAQMWLLPLLESYKQKIKEQCFVVSSQHFTFESVGKLINPCIYLNQRHFQHEIWSDKQNK